MNSHTQPSLDDYYGPAAYRSNDLPDLPPTNRSDDLVGRLRTPLRWGHYAQLEAWQDTDAYLKPGSELYRDSLERTGKTDLFINHQRWNFENFGAFLILVPFLKVTCLVFWPWLFWGFAVSGAFAWPHERPMSESELNSALGLMSLIVFLSFSMIVMSGWLLLAKRVRRTHYLCQISTGFLVALTTSLLTFQTSPYGLGLFIHCGIMALLVFMGWIGWDFLLDLYLRLFAHDGSAFNRQTGMLSFARRFRQPFVAPFYEFDPVMEYRPDRYGGGGYALWLFHRYTSNKVFLGARVQSLGMRMKDCLAFWDTLQRYMDVSQPLPDLPILEQFRHLDPTTAEHDRKSGRSPRHWRDMGYETWEKKGVGQRMKRIDTYPWQSKPCIVETKIDTSLNIETYYRRQEAKGIQATPKGDDYDNIHRG